MRLSFIRNRRKATFEQQREPRPAVIDRLEGRIYFAHLGHVVELPAAAAHGARGLEAAINAPGDHRRGKLVLPQ